MKYETVHCLFSTNFSLKYLLSTYCMLSSAEQNDLGVGKHYFFAYPQGAQTLEETRSMDPGGGPTTGHSTPV